MAPRKTIKGCEKKIEALTILSESRYKTIREKETEIRELSTKVRNLEFDKTNAEHERQRIEGEKKSLKKKLWSIVEVLAGEAKPESKAEVITDLLSFRVGVAKEEKKMRKQQPNNYHDVGEAFF